MRVGGAIIAGGRGSRMGDPHKAALRLRDGSTPVRRLLAALAEAGCAPLLIVANDPAPYADCAVRVEPDRRPGLGPLAGIEAALSAMEADAVVIVAGDMPALRGPDLARLLAGFDGRLAVAVTDRMQPLCAVVGMALAGEVTAALDRGEHGVYRLWERLGAVAVRFADAAPFADLDTPEDLARCQ